jgi:hypothetical protein
VAHARITLTCLLALSLSSQSCSRPSGPPPCGCVSLDLAARGLEKVSARDWRQIDRSVLEADWPQLPCEPGNGGLPGIAEVISSCCEKCELCGGAAMDEGPGLRMADLWVCPRPLESQRAALQVLVQAVIGSRPDIKATSTSRTDDRFIEGYSWVSNGELFTLRADAIRTDDVWIGNFQLGRCRSENVIDTWRIDADITVRVIGADVKPSTGKERVLWFQYVSTCLRRDGPCQATELDQLWPRLRSLAGRHEATAITITAEDCAGSSVSFQVDRASDGQWKGGLWSPKEK